MGERSILRCTLHFAAFIASFARIMRTVTFRLREKSALPGVTFRVKQVHVSSKAIARNDIPFLFLPRNRRVKILSTRSFSNRAKCYFSTGDWQLIASSIFFFNRKTTHLREKILSIATENGTVFASISLAELRFLPLLSLSLHKG